MNADLHPLFTSKWGNPVEVERRRRIFVCAWAYAYEVLNEHLVEDSIFDAECRLVNINMKTGHDVLDTFFRIHFNPATGMWIHKHPEKQKLHALTQRLLLRKQQHNMQPNLSDPNVRKELARKIREDIDNYCIKLYDDGHRNHMGASVIGDDCERKIWSSFRWLAKFKSVDKDGKDQRGRMLRLFNRGHKEEERFIEWLEGIGIACQPLGPDGKQWRISGCNGHFGGSLDGKARLEPYGIIDVMLLEFKTSSTKYFYKLVENGVKAEKHQHYVQMCSYGKAYELKYALYMCVNKDTDEIYYEIVELDWNLAHTSLLKADNIIKATVPPAKIALTPTYYKCKGCDFSDICHNNATPDKNCRSCVNAFPVDNGEWLCKLYQQNIPKDYIKNGCDSWVSIV